MKTKTKGAKPTKYDEVFVPLEAMFPIEKGWLGIQLFFPAGFTIKITRIAELCKKGKMREANRELTKMHHYQNFRVGFEHKALAMKQKRSLTKKAKR